MSDFRRARIRAIGQLSAKTERDALAAEPNPVDLASGRGTNDPKSRAAKHVTLARAEPAIQKLGSRLSSSFCSISRGIVFVIDDRSIRISDLDDSAKRVIFVGRDASGRLQRESRKKDGSKR